MKPCRSQKCQLDITLKVHLRRLQSCLDCVQGEEKDINSCSSLKSPRIIIYSLQLHILYTNPPDIRDVKNEASAMLLN